MQNFIVYALENKHTGNRWVDVAYNLKHKVKQVKKIVNERSKASFFNRLFWSEVYDFDDLIVVILFRSDSKEEAKKFAKTYKKTHKPAYNAINRVYR